MLAKNKPSITGSGEASGNQCLLLFFSSPRRPLLHIRRFRRRRRRRSSPQILSANSNWRSALPPTDGGETDDGAAEGLTTLLIGPSNAMHDGFFNWTPLFS